MGLKQIIAVNNIQTMEYICMSPAHIPLNMFNNRSKTAFRILNFDIMKLSHFPGLPFFSSAVVIAQLLQTRNSHNRPRHFDFKQI